MAELSGHVSALAGLARGISTAATAPLSGMSAFVFGLRRAIMVRRSLQAAVMADGRDSRLGGSPGRPAITAGVTSAGRDRAAHR
jgi:hypothetical protein